MTNNRSRYFESSTRSRSIWISGGARRRRDPCRRAGADPHGGARRQFRRARRAGDRDRHRTRFAAPGRADRPAGGSGYRRRARRRRRRSNRRKSTEQTELPKGRPTETDDPDRVVTPNDNKKPKADDPKLATVQAQPSVESAAVEETATPTVPNAQEAPASTAPALGTGESAQRERATWQKELAAHFNKYKRYPADRIARNAEVVVSFVLDRVGHVLSTRLVRGFRRCGVRRRRARDAAPVRPGAGAAAARRRRWADVYAPGYFSRQWTEVTGAGCLTGRGGRC